PGGTRRRARSGPPRARAATSRAPTAPAASAQPPPATRVQRQQREAEERRREQEQVAHVARVDAAAHEHLEAVEERQLPEDGEGALAHRRLVPGDDPEEEQHAVGGGAGDQLAVGERRQEEPARGERGGEQRETEVAGEERSPGDGLQP